MIAGGIDSGGTPRSWAIATCTACCSAGLPTGPALPPFSVDSVTAGWAAQFGPVAPG